MSYQECEAPECAAADSSVDIQVIKPHQKDLGDGFVVRRVLPADSPPRVGPFIFFDHMGPSTFSARKGIDVRPHPHIGLSTLTYLFDGAIMHRDSLGFEQRIEPGAVNWMTAGRGIVHSERTPDDLRESGHVVHGIQIWIALPDGSEEVDPSFTHIPAGSLPTIVEEGVELTLIAGEAFGMASPVKTYSRLFYLHTDVQAGQPIPVPQDCVERAIYIVSGELEVDGTRFDERQMLVLGASSAEVRATSASTLMLIGGEPLASDRIVWWNFSSSSAERLEQAKRDWVDGKFDAVPGETEFIPLPE